MATLTALRQSDALLDSKSPEQVSSRFVWERQQNAYERQHDTDDGKPETGALKPHA